MKGKWQRPKTGTLLLAAMLNPSEEADVVVATEEDEVAAIEEAAVTEVVEVAATVEVIQEVRNDGLEVGKATTEMTSSEKELTTIRTTPQRTHSKGKMWKTFTILRRLSSTVKSPTIMMRSPTKAEEALNEEGVVVDAAAPIIKGHSLLKSRSSDLFFSLN